MADRRMFSREILKSSVMVKLGAQTDGLEAQRVFETLILTADDHGKGRFIPAIIRGEAFISVPETFSKVTPEMIEIWCRQIEAEGALLIYEVGGQSYYKLTGWEKHQRGGWQPANSLLPDPGQTADGEQTDSGQGADGSPTRDEVKLNKSKVKEKKKKAPILPDWCAALVQECFPEASKREQDIYRQAKVIADLERLDGHPEAEICEVVRWGRADAFWQANLLSAASLRDKRDGITTKYLKIKASKQREVESVYNKGGLPDWS